MTRRFLTGYFDAPWERYDEILALAKKHMKNVDFDTFVATGNSGVCMLIPVAQTLGKNFVIVRKPDDGSHGSGQKVLGEIGDKWVFFDDFISSGATLKRVMQALEEECISAEFVGAFRYERETADVWMPASDITPERYYALRGFWPKPKPKPVEPEPVAIVDEIAEFDFDPAVIDRIKENLSAPTVPGCSCEICTGRAFKKKFEPRLSNSWVYDGPTYNCLAG